MYQVCAEINDVEYRKVLLDEDFQFSADKLLAAADEHTKLIFLCSPNNPTGNDLLRSEIEKIIREFDGLVILDEAYNDFSEAPSFLDELDKYPNLIVLQTFSKAWGCAAIRLGMAFASQEIISIFSKIKYPYNVNLLTQKEAIAMMHRHYEVERWVKSLLEERARLIDEIIQLPCWLSDMRRKRRLLWRRTWNSVCSCLKKPAAGRLTPNRQRSGASCAKATGKLSRQIGKTARLRNIFCIWPNVLTGNAAGCCAAVRKRKKPRRE